jgi:hypothetical protein
MIDNALNSLMASVRVLPFVAASSEASSTWSSLPDRSDPRVLDWFIARYPCSREAALALSLRHQILRAAPSIPEYHRFIGLYRTRAGSELALCELYDLIRKEDRLGGYADFLRRYPESPLARAAELWVHALSFAAVCKFKEVAEYEAFLETFPRAAQVPVVLALSTAQDLADAQAVFDAKKAALTNTEFRDWRDDHANTLVVKWGLLMKHVIELWGLASATPEQLAEALPSLDKDKDASDKLLTYHQLARLEAVVTGVFSEAPAAVQLVLTGIDLVVFKYMMDELKQVTQAVEREHADLAGLVKAEFAETRRVLADGFDRLRQDLKATGEQVVAAVKDGLAGVGQKLDALHADLGGVQNELRQIHTVVDSVENQVEKSNKALNRLDKSVREVAKELGGLTAAVKGGFTDLGQQVQGMRGELARGFDRVGTAIAGIDLHDPQSGGLLDWVTEGTGGLATLSRIGGQAADQLWKKGKEAGGRIAEQSKKAGSDLRQALKKALDYIPDITIVPFDFTTNGSLLLNASTGCNFGKLDLPLGLTVTTSEIANPQLPKFDFTKFLQFAVRALGFTLSETDEYENTRNAALTASTGSLYFSSRRFVEWTSPQTIASYIAKLVATSGGSFKDVVSDIVEQISLEFNDIVAWLSFVLPESAESVIDAVVEAVVHQHKPALNIPNLTIDVIDVPYVYRLQPGPGTEVLGKFLKKVLGPIPDPASWLLKEIVPDAAKDLVPNFADLLAGKAQAATVMLKAVVITFAGDVSRDQWLKKQIEKLNSVSLSVAVQTPEVLVKQLIKGSALGKIIERVENLLPPGVEDLVIAVATGQSVDTVLRDKLLDLIKLPSVTLPPLPAVPSPYIDLTKSPIAAQLQAVFGSLAIGNEEHPVKVTKLELDLSSYSFHLQVSVRHRLVWKLKDLIQLGDEAAEMVKELTGLKFL